MFQIDTYPEISKLIQETVKAEKIFVLATTKSEQQTESIFTKTPIKKSYTTHLYLLVLISKDQNCIYYEIQNQIETLCAPICSVTVLAIEMEMFNEWLREGHPFAVPVKTNALLMYDNGSIPLSEHKAINDDKRFGTRKQFYKVGIANMQELIKAARLHDACIAGLMTILRATIGLELQTNNIDKLIRYCTMVIKEMPVIFPGNGYELNPPVEKIEALLQSLYSVYKLIETQEPSFS